MRFVFVVFLLFFASISFAFTPKAVDSMDVKITQSGSIDIVGSMQYINISMFIPQGETSVTTTGTWKYTYDKLGNKMLLLEWQNPLSTSYKVETLVENEAEHLLSESDIGYNEEYLEECGKIIINDDIRELAYPYEKSLKGVADLAILVYDLVDYDKEFIGMNSDWVFDNKKGACGEYSALHIALLRSKGIPARYVTGYAYSGNDEEFVDHAWVEVLTTTGWVSFDPTWLEGGYLDATHIKTGHLVCGNASGTITYVGTGDIQWTVNPDFFEVIDYTEKTLTEMDLSSEDFMLNGYGYLRADITSDECVITDITARSCTSPGGSRMLNIYDDNRKFWVCGEKDQYFFFSSSGLSKGYMYTCPITVYDQVGSSESEAIKFYEEKFVPSIDIRGPDTVGINEVFTLEAYVSNDFIFYSDLGRHYNKKWTGSFETPGIYTFYLYSNNDLAIKEVDVKEEKEFSLRVSLPDNATLGSSFILDVTVENLMNREKDATIKVGDYEEAFTLSASSSRRFSFNISADSPGVKKIPVIVTADTLTSYSTSILVYEERVPSIFDPIIGFFAWLFESIIGFFTTILSFFG